jgi:hypothetical protein
MENIKCYGSLQTWCNVVTYYIFKKHNTSCKLCNFCYECFKPKKKDEENNYISIVLQINKMFAGINIFL